jgi:hypothetical protein
MFSPNNKSTALERAFELDESGSFNCADEIRAQLRLEGYSTEQIVGGYLFRQLRAVMEKANPQLVKTRRPRGRRPKSA